MNNELDDIISQKKLTPKFYKDAAVKVVTWDNQWAGIDDEETLQMRGDFARSHCLSGLMVWAVSHDTKAGQYSEAIAKAASRKSTSLRRKNPTSGSDIIVKVPHNQCRWSNCGEPCWTGWKAVFRSDDGFRKGKGFDRELMLDETGCDGTGVHTFCCPGDQVMPSCGWFTHNNGKCDPTCPKGMIEVGSNQMYCGNGKYQAACYDTNNIGTSVYNTCTWGEWPRCGAGQCPVSGGPRDHDKQLASSVTGSGGAQCEYMAKPEEFDLWGRKYCCNDRNEDERFENCQWFDDIGPAPAGRPHFCRSGGPANTVRVALDRQGGGCKNNGGARARCCAAIRRDDKKVPNPEIEHYKKVLQEFTKQPTCPAVPFRLQRSLSSMETWPNTSWSNDLSLDNRLTSFDNLQKPLLYSDVERLLLRLLTRAGSQTLAQVLTTVWVGAVISKWPNLTIDNLERYTRSWPEWQKHGPMIGVHKIVCALDYFNKRVGDFLHHTKVAPLCKVTVDDGRGDLDGGGSAFPTCKRKRVPPRLRSIDQTTALQVRDPILGEEDHKIRLQTRGKQVGQPRDLDQNFPQPSGSSQTRTFTSTEYPGPCEFDEEDEIYYNILLLEDEDDCLNDNIQTSRWEDIPEAVQLQVDHPNELNTVGRFILDAYIARLPDGTRPTQPARITMGYVDSFRRNWMTNPPSLPGGLNTNNPNQTAFEILGSTRLTNNFVILMDWMNRLKSRLWRFYETSIYADDRMNTWTGNRGSETDRARAYRAFRDVIATFRALNRPYNHERMMVQANSLRNEWRVQDSQWNAIHGPNTNNLAGFWDEWYRNYLSTSGQRARVWMRNWINTMRVNYATHADANVRQGVEQVLSEIEGSIDEVIRIGIDGLI